MPPLEMSTAHVTIHLVDGADAGPAAAAGGPLVVAADAPLAEGLRALLEHHLERSGGEGSWALSEGQTELLDYHVARLAAYTQKVIHTLTFAARFFAAHDSDGGLQGEHDSTHAAGASSAGARASTGPSCVAAGGLSAAPPQPQRTRKPLQLSDEEILSLYRCAQAEAAREADWRGIRAPSPRRRGASAAALLFPGRTKLHL